MITRRLFGGLFGIFPSGALASVQHAPFRPEDRFEEMVISALVYRRAFPGMTVEIDRTGGVSVSSNAEVKAALANRMTKNGKLGRFIFPKDE